MTNLIIVNEYFQAGCTYNSILHFTILIIDRLKEFDEYLADEIVKALKEELYN